VGRKDPMGWLARRQRLAVAPVDRLPQCAGVLTETDSDAVIAAALVVLDEVQRELHWIDEQLGFRSSDETPGRSESDQDTQYGAPAMLTS
jgi:hypothetical protein